MHKEVNKEVTDALHALLSMALENKKYTTQKEQYDIVYKEIERLNNIINELEKKLLELRLTDVDGKTIVYRLLNKLQELKGSDKE